MNLTCLRVQNMANRQTNKAIDL